MSLLSLAVGIPVLIYLLLWLGPVREQLRIEAQDQLSSLLAADVDIRELDVEPFTRLILRDASVAVAPADTVLNLRELSAGFSLRDLLLRRRIVITDVVLMDPDIELRRDSIGAPLNLQPVIDALKGDGSKPPVDFDLAVNTLIIRGGRVSYDVMNAQPAANGTDLHHLKIRGLNADVNAPGISRDSVSVRLRRLQFYETGGLNLTRLSGDVVYTPERLTIDGLTLRLPQSALNFGNIDLALKGARLGSVELKGGSRVMPSDLASLLPFDLSVISDPVEISGNVDVFRDSLQLNRLNLRVGDMFALSGFGNRSEQHLKQISINSSGDEISRIAGAFTLLPQRAENILANLGDVSLRGAAARAKSGVVELRADIESAIGALSVDASLRQRRLSGKVAAEGLDLGRLLPGRDLGNASFSSGFDLCRGAGSAEVDVKSIRWRGHDYRELAADVEYNGDSYLANIGANDSVLSGQLSITAGLTPGDMAGEVALVVARLRPDIMGIWDKYPGYSLSGNLSGAFKGPELTKTQGELEMTEMRFAELKAGGVQYVESPLRLEFDLASEENFINLESGPLDLQARGEINLKSLPAQARRLADKIFPQLLLSAGGAAADDTLRNNFTAEAVIHEQSPLFDLVSLPLRPLFDADVSAEFISERDSARVNVRMPYLQAGKKLIRDAELNLHAGAEGSLSAKAEMDNKKGRAMNFDLHSKFHDGVADSRLGWKVASEKRFDGMLNFAVKPLLGGADVQINESEMLFNNAVWTVSPAYVGARAVSIVIGNLLIEGPGQQALIRGVASADSSDVLTVKLDNIDLDYLFETLNLGPQVTFGGMATGTVTGRGVLSPEAILQTNDLYVRDFSYNHCVFGNADLRAEWDSASRGILIKGDVKGDGETAALIDGVIYPLSQNLDITFDARHLPVGFMQPFLATWADEVGGHASGKARLFGSFVLVDLEGDLYAEDFSLKVGYTGVTYHATDSVHIRPGRIELKDIAVSDSRGNTARLDGILTHDHFIESDYNFRVSDARAIQVIDLPADPEEMWYGSVFGSGSVRIAGHTGQVDISADMQTAPGSDFTFALTSAERAAEYDFLTFRSASGISPADSLEQALKNRLTVNRRFEEVMRRKQLLAETPTVFGIRIRMDVTPQARINLVMDPVAGDKITAYGAGHLDLIYESANDEMRLYGDYLINRGDYNFTLQDIIIKNFSIRDGSVVAFHGDPLDASLNVSAAYQLNANLSDLDNSFLHDKEVQRTNVPVQAVLNLGGDLQSPDISFDLDFPTLTSDVKRKVRSIVSTDEMMNRQIIYLLALNRFYTPDYMAGATKGNELASLASGTISSQLSNILGQLSNKFSVAPSVRSDAGDFSDIEFDVALSSTLLNNRLLLNGNLGYRDKSLNNNQFIGDFDVEYLLNRTGKWRIKAYNHFNDRNLYVKTALTTQGLGLVFKHDWGK